MSSFKDFITQQEAAKLFANRQEENYIHSIRKSAVEQARLAKEAIKKCKDTGKVYEVLTKETIDLLLELRKYVDNLSEVQKLALLTDVQSEASLRLQAAEFNTLFERFTATCQAVIEVPQNFDNSISHCRQHGMPITDATIRPLLVQLENPDEINSSVSCMENKREGLNEILAFAQLHKLAVAGKKSDEKKEQKRQTRIKVLMTSAARLLEEEKLVEHFPWVSQLATDMDFSGTTEMSSTPSTVLPKPAVNNVAVINPKKNQVAAVESNELQQSVPVSVTNALFNNSSSSIPVLIEQQQIVALNNGTNFLVPETMNANTGVTTLKEAVTEYMNDCKASFPLMVNLPLCTCKRKFNAVSKCIDCRDNQFKCYICGKDHTRKLTNKSHNVLWLCPVCGNFDQLFHCKLCMASAVSNEGISCRFCQESRHGYINHDPSLVLQLFHVESSLDFDTNKNTAEHVPNINETNQPVADAAVFSLNPSSIDDELMFMIHSRAALEEIAQPIVIEYFRCKWNYVRNCSACSNNTHLFDTVKKCCLDEVCKDLHPKNSAVQCINGMRGDDIVSCLQNYFDLGALCNLVKAFCSKWRLSLESQSLQNLTSDRGACWHKRVMSLDKRDALFRSVEIECTTLISEYPKNILWNKFLIESKIEMIKFENSDLLGKFRKQILSENLRCKELKVIELVSASLVEKIVKYSKSIADLLCSENDLKFLVIPVLEGGTPVDGLETDTRAAYREKLKFLFDVPWAGILDLNSLWFTDRKKPETLMSTAFKNSKLVLTTEKMSDLSGYGKSYMLYTVLVNDIIHLRSHFNGLHSYIIIAGFTNPDLSSNAERMLADNLTGITNQLYVGEKDWKIIPIVSHMSGLLMLPSLRHFLCEKTFGENSEDLTEYSELVSDVSFIASFVSGRMINEETIWLPAASRFHGRVGFPVQKLSQFYNCMEVLSYDCESQRKHVSRNEIIAWDNEQLSEEDIRKVVVKNEQERFLCNSKAASWMLFVDDPKQGKKLVVRREIVGEIVATIRLRDQNLTKILLHHAIGSGASTAARHVLFELKHEFMCIVIFDTPRDFAGVKSLFNKLQVDTQLPLLVLLDFKSSEYACEQLQTHLTTFICTSQLDQATSELSRSLRLQSGSDSTVSFVLPITPTTAEQFHFQELFNSIAVDHKSIFLDGICIDGYFSRLGNLNIEKSFNGTVAKQLVAKSDDELIHIGLSPNDILKLRRQFFLHSSDFQRSTNFNSNDVSLAPILYGLFAFLPEYEKSASQFVLKLLNHLADKEILVIKLCCFYALFAPSEKVPRLLADYILNGNQKLAAPVCLSYPMLQLVEVEKSTSPGYVSIKVLRLAYILAKTDLVFGKLEKWCDTIYTYLIEELFCVLENPSPFQPELIKAVEYGFHEVIVNFKIWHPENERPADYKSTRYSFLIEMMYRSPKKDFIKEIMDRCVNLFQHSFSNIYFVTHTARYLTNLAYNEINFDVLCKAEKLLLDIVTQQQKNDNFSSAFDRLGHLYKTHLRIIAKLITEGKVELKFDCVVNKKGGSGGYLFRHKNEQEYSRTTLTQISFDLLCEIALEADRWFMESMKASYFAFPNPLIGAVQVWDSFLEIVRFCVCNNSYNEFWTKYNRNATTDILGVFDKIRKLEVFEFCSDYLHAARNAAKFKKKCQEKDHEKAKFEREYFSVHNQGTTNGKIWSLWRSIDLYFKDFRDVRNFSSFNLVTAKHMMNSKMDSKLSCDEIVFCLLSLADALFPAISCKDQCDLHSITIIEQLVTSSCLLTNRNSSDVEGAMSYFSDESFGNTGLVKKLTYHTLMPKIDSWISSSQKGGNYGLSARVSKLALLVWNILINNDKNCFSELAKCVMELNIESGKYLYTDTARLFLAKKCVNEFNFHKDKKTEENPFTAFYFRDSLPFATSLKPGLYMEHEKLYASKECYDCLHVCEGELKQGNKQNFVVSCGKLQLHDIFMFSQNAVFPLKVNMEVSFVLAIRDAGLVALGVQPIHGKKSGG
eukprot:CAMPEP_0170131378 /NCGR_PEP_ID=MMETSP0020_2-20130122/23209_1 /TAXON_ID=98059 /ORGANISM="Dinobryon sp., Strain UTEXLB2267" /LENGTH=1995 /DNA_ID=CAMNT_0010366435 /DNA_START=1004 /DNA_END=6991 /DNA_ORIENTATION=+